LLKLIILLSSLKVFHFFSFFLSKLASRFTSQKRGAQGPKFLIA
jgi:hypothetical protein